MPALGGVRARLTAVVVALVVLATIVLGVGAALFVDARLHAQTLQAAADQAGFDLSVTVPERQLPDQPTAEDIDRSALADTFARRGVRTVVDLGAGQPPFLSDIALEGLLEQLPAEMRDLVASGQLAYTWMDVGTVPLLVIGGRPADGGPAFYFVHDVSGLQDAVDQLRLALILGAIFLLLVALAAVRVVVRGVLAPVEEAGRIAERIERGDLAARVPVTSRDEFGTWAERFNLMADALADTIRRLEAAQQQNRRFVADVSHELRTPLAALVAEASIVGEHLDEFPPASRRAAELLVADVGRLRELVEELMELSRFDASAEEVALEPVDLVRLIRAVIAARQPTASFEPLAPSIVIETDPRRLDRILGNFLDNAREHAGGSDVRVDLDTGEEALVIAVSDRGPGVPEDRLQRIFERFTKLDPSRSGGSSGLGLAIAAEHAALLGGYLQAMNRDGGGLRLELVLPRSVTRSLPGGDGPVTESFESGTPTTTREPQP